MKLETLFSILVFAGVVIAINSIVALHVYIVWSVGNHLVGPWFTYEHAMGWTILTSVAGITFKLK